MMTRWIRLLIAVAAMAMASCSSGTLEPQPLALDVHNCAQCGMLISELSDAAQAVAPGEDARFYDDRGCLARDATRLPASARLFVQHDGGAGWVDVHEAFFAFPKDARTPMGYGLTAFRTKEAAAAGDREGRALSWADARAEVMQ
jgi:copper chaperone NosL